MFRCVLTRVQAELGHLEDARRNLDELASDGFAVLPPDTDWPAATSLLAETSCLLNDRPTGTALYRLMLPYADKNVANIPESNRGAMGRYLGLLAAEAGRWRQAERHFDAALRMNDEMGARTWLALTQLDHARMLLARDAVGDQERADELRRQALETCRELGVSVPNRR